MQLIGVADADADRSYETLNPGLSRGPIVAAVLFAIIGSVALLANGGVSDPAEVLPATTTTTTGSATTRARSLATPPPSSTTVRPAQRSFFGDDFEGIAEADGLSLAVLLHGTSPGLRLVDLATGAERAFAGPSADGGTYSASIMVPVDEGLVLLSGPTAYAQQFRHSAPLEVGEATEIVPSDATSFWLVAERHDGLGRQVAELRDVSGAVLDSVDVAAGTYPVGAWRELLIVESASGVRAVTSGGSAFLISGTAVSVGGDGLLLASQCDGRLECGFEIVDLETGASRSLDLEASIDDGLVGSVSISPDGQAVAFVSFGTQRSTVQIVDLSTGNAEPLVAEPSYGPLVWSPDGRFLAWATYASISLYDRWTSMTHVVDIEAVGFADGEGADRGLALVSTPGDLG